MSYAELLRKWRNEALLIPSQEIIYRELFLRDLGKMGIEDQFNPVRGAANHSLLYLLTRTFRQFEIGSAIEFGGGQSTLLLNSMRKVTSPSMRICTIEHEKPWAEMLGAQVDHEVIFAPLHGTGTKWGKGFYDPGFVPQEKFNLLLIDGPQSFPGRDRLARNGFADVFLSRLADDFIVIVDDAERPGEKKLVKRIRETLRGARIDFKEGEATALSKQKLFCGGSLSTAAYF